MKFYEIFVLMTGQSSISVKTSVTTSTFKVVTDTYFLTLDTFYKVYHTVTFARLIQKNGVSLGSFLRTTFLLSL